MRSPRLAGPVAAAALLAATIGRADPLPARAERVADYDIRVRLDPGTHQLAGQQRVTWRNPSTDSVPDLWFHLYLNAFKNTESTFVRESGGQLRGMTLTGDGWGWVEVTSLKLADGTDLRPALRFEHPDDDNDRDRTVARVVLPQPVPPGGEVTLDIAFRAQLPRAFARTGYSGDFHLAGQWFPKLGVYEPAGMRGRVTGAWNCHQFHALSEFYADFGHYRVEMTVPRRFVVGASGHRVSRRDGADGTSTYVHEESDIHDFAWAADPGFVEVRRTFSATADVTAAEYEAAARLLGRTGDEVRLSDVEVILLLQKGHLPQLERHVAAAWHALKYFGLRYGRYPYRTLTIVDPAPGADGTLGTEYPTLFTAGTSFLFNRGPLRGVLFPENVVVHEFGHQYWYGMVANNEFEEAWLDEGIDSYSTGKVLAEAYGRDTSMLSAFGLRVGDLELARSGNGPRRRFERIRARAWDYSSEGAYGFNSYARPQLMLLTLEGLLGEETMARVLRTYHERWRFRHPASEDFFAVASEVSGRDLTDFFRQTVLTGDILDYEVATVTSARVAEPQGDLEGRPASVGERPFESTVLVRRRGEVVLPVEVAFQFEGQDLERATWDGKDRWKRFRFVRPERLLWARVDPDRKRELDVNRLNDALRVGSDGRAAARWTTRFLFYVQNLLALFGA
jgi:hypothetical protein